MGDFFRYLWDHEYKQRDDIDDLQLKVKQLATSGSSVDDVIRLTRRVDAVARDVTILKTALSVVTEALVELGGLDKAALDARIDAAVQRQLPKHERAPAPMTCRNCGLSYPAAQMNGELCKRCAAL